MNVRYSNMYFNVIILLLNQCLNGAILLQGDIPTTSGQTFSFPVKASAIGFNGDNFFVASHPTLGSPKEFAISVITSTSKKFDALAPLVVTLNGTPGAKNPIYDQHIQYFNLMVGKTGPGQSSVRDENISAVLTSEPQGVYVIDTFFGTTPLSVLNVPYLKDTSGTATTSGIVGLGNLASSVVVAAVKSSTGGNFGDPGSGLAFLAIDTTKKETDGTVKTTRTMTQLDFGTGTPVAGVTRALPLDRSSAVLTINSPLTSIQNNAFFAFDNRLSNDQIRTFLFFGGLQVQGGAGVTDGARAVYRFILKGTAFELGTIAPDSAFDALGDYIVGGVGSNKQISVHGLKPMFTSTDLNYLIVFGGTGAPNATLRTVYALPVVNNIENLAVHGVLADKNQIPPTLDAKSFGFKAPATLPAQMTLATDVAAQVGGGAILNGDITDMFVNGDSVFVSVQIPDVNQQPGVFYSQALFDQYGKIKAWTTWKRVGGNTDQNYAAGLDTLANFTMMSGATADSIQTIKRTVWGLGEKDGLLGGTTTDSSVGLVTGMGSYLPNESGGIQGLFNFPSNTPGLNGVSLVIAVGDNKVLLAETGNSSSGSFQVNFGNFSDNQQNFINGTITQTQPAAGTLPRIVTITGGQLSGMGPITTAEIAVGTFGGSPTGRLFVGGTNALSVLINPDGSGWDATTGLAAGFQGLLSGMSFKPVGNYSFIRRLVSDQNYLYVMTDKKVDRIDVSASSFGPSSALVVTTVAEPTYLPGLNNSDTFLDLIVSGKFAVLCSSKGIHRVGNGADIRTAADAGQLNWTPVPVPSNVGPVIEFFPITVSGRSQDSAQTNGSTLYVLNAYIGKNMGQINRFSIADISASAITDQTIQPLPDFFVTLPGQKSFLYNFNGFRDHIATDGAPTFDTKHRNLAQSPFVNVIFGMHSAVNMLPIQTVPLDLIKASLVQKVVRSFASGAWLVAGDFGFQVSE